MVASREVSVGAVVVLGVVLVLLRVGFSLVGGWQSATLNAEVSATLRGELAGAYLRADWPTQHDETSGQLQDLLTSFSASGAAVVASFLNAITSGLSLAALLLFAVLVDPVAAFFTMTGCRSTDHVDPSNPRTRSAGFAGISKGRDRLRDPGQ